MTATGGATPRVRTNRILAILALVLAGVAAVAGDTPAPGGPGEITALDLARAIRETPDGILILDVRDAAAFEEFSVPRARLVEGGAAAESVLEAARAAGAAPDDLIVIAGGQGADARPGWLALRREGHRRVHWVRDVLGSWLDEIVSPVLPPDASDREREAWDEQADLSRYFGGFPRIATREDASGGTTDRLRRAKRRGCAF